MDFDFLHVAGLVFADVLRDATPCGLQAFLVAQLHIQVLLHVEGILCIQALKKSGHQLVQSVWRPR